VGKEIEKISIHYKDGTVKVIRKMGMVAYVEEPDLWAEFLNVDGKDIPKILKGLIFSLQMAQEQHKRFEE
jgi:hypothetical protein